MARFSVGSTKITMFDPSTVAMVESAAAVPPIADGPCQAPSANQSLTTRPDESTNTTCAPSALIAIGDPARAAPPIAVGPCQPVVLENVSSTTFPDGSMNTTFA